jgi:hypothetical protein
MQTGAFLHKRNFQGRTQKRRPCARTILEETCKNERPCARTIFRDARKTLCPHARTLCRDARVIIRLCERTISRDATKGDLSARNISGDKRKKRRQY